MKKLVIALSALWLIVGMAPFASGQAAMSHAPNCLISFSFTAAGSSSGIGTSGAGVGFDNRGRACTVWTMTYQSTGFSAVSIEAQEAPLSTTGDATGTFITWPSAQVYSGTLPLTTTTVSQISMFGYHPWVHVTLNSKTGTGRIYGTMMGWAVPIDASTGALSVSLSGGAPASVIGTVRIEDTNGNPILNSDIVTVQTADPCQSGTKVYFPFNGISASQILVAGSSAKKIYICSINLIPDSAVNIALVEGTGALCVTGLTGVGTGTTGATGYVFPTGGGWSQGGGGFSILQTANVAYGFCALFSAAVPLKGGFYYVQQ